MRLATGIIILFPQLDQSGLLNAFIQQLQFWWQGVLLSTDLSWSAHVDSICTKAKKLVELLYRRFSTNTNSLLEMYQMLVHPHPEYTAQVWNPTLTKDIMKLENVQKFALKMCAKSWDSGYQDLLDWTQMPTLNWESQIIFKSLNSLQTYSWSFLFPTQCIYFST